MTFVTACGSKKGTKAPPRKGRLSDVAVSDNTYSTYISADDSLRKTPNEVRQTWKD